MTTQTIEDNQRTTASGQVMSAFDDVTKGDPAPTWVTDGVLASWDLDPARTDLTLITVSENATFRVDVDGAPYAVVRLSRPGYVADPRQISSELAWLHALGEEVDVPVSHAIEGADGEFVQVIGPRPDQGWYAVMFGFIEGAILEDIADPVPYYERIGAITAIFHQHSRTWTPPSGFTRFSWTLPDMVGPTARWGDWRGADLDASQRTLLEHAEAEACDIAWSIEDSPRNWGIIHADLRPSNIMIDEDRLIVIDFDDCGHAPYLFDFAAALSFMEHTAFAPEMARRWMQGYQSVIPLTDDEVEQACALSMIRRLQMLGWTTTHREDALPPELNSAQVPGTVEVAAAYVVDHRWLLA